MISFSTYLVEQKALRATRDDERLTWLGIADQRARDERAAARRRLAEEAEDAELRARLAELKRRRS